MLDVQSLRRKPTAQLFQKVNLETLNLWNRCFFTQKNVPEPRLVEKGHKEASRSSELRPEAAVPCSRHWAGQRRDRAGPQQVGTK